MGKNLYIDKSTATPADNLLAFGLAQCLSAIPPDDDLGLQIIDRGDSFELALKQPIEEKWLAELDYFHLFRGLDTSKKSANLPASHRIDYIGHQQSNQLFYESLKSGLKEDQLREQGIRPPVPDWSAWAVINQMSAVDTYNKLAELWYAHRDCFPKLIRIILDLYSSRPNPIEETEYAWKILAKDYDIDGKSQIAQLQVINPGMGKGGNRSKANGLVIRGLKGFWIPEYLKFAGLFQAAIPHIIKDNSKDRKTYILRPKALSWRTHLSVFPAFQRIFFRTTSVKMDALATLRYCQVFIEQWKQGQESGWSRFIRGQPGDHVAAVDVVHYKYLGSAHATMNISTLVLPEWLPAVETIEQADQYLELLDEHRRIVLNLDEKIGDEYELLRKYRDFLSARDLQALFQFNRGYSQFIMRKLVPGKYAPRQFTLPNLEVLIMAHEPKLSPIVKNEGFLRIAEAIRRSTVLPQYQKAQGRESLYEIRYGLGDKLLRHAQYAGDFIQELSQFMHDYNRENARKSETRKQQFRTNITTDDINAIVELIDTFGAPTIANMLVAYGYARDPKTGAPTGEDQKEESSEEISEFEGINSD